MRTRIVLGLVCLSAGVAGATPPGMPLSNLLGRQMSLGVYYDYSGQSLFREGSASVLHTTGVGLEYGILDYVGVGAFAGGSVLNVDVPPGSNSDTLRAFNSNFGPYGGLSAKLATPRFWQNTSRLVGYGQAAFLHAEDNAGNVKQGMVYNAGLSLQAELNHTYNFVLGGEYYYLDGEQQAAGGGTQFPFGLNAGDGTIDYFRGLIGFEYFFKGPNRPFISFALRPTGSMSYRSGFGLQGISLSVTLGAITSFDKQAEQRNGDAGTSIDDD